MSEQEAVAYCTRCGSALRDGACPIHGVPLESIEATPPADPTPRPMFRGRRMVWPLLLAVLVATNALTWFSLRGEIRSVRRSSEVAASDAAARLDAEKASAERLDRRLTDVESGADSLAGKVGTLEDAFGRIPDPVALIKAARGSVFTVFAGPYEGSAFAIGSSGGRTLLITNFHVVAANWDAGRHSAAVVQGDDNFTGRIEKVHRSDDLALLSISGDYEPLVAFTDRVEVGDAVIALGSPFGLEGTASTGIVSSVRDGYVQFSAAISPGSSGGPLLDAHGRVIGVNTAKVSGFGAEGLSFAIPIGVACDGLVSC
jgi:putative serine protease PepD